MEGVLHADELLDLALEEPADRNAGGPADHLGHVLGVHLLLEEALGLLQLVEGGGGLFDLALEIGDQPVGDLRGLGQVAVAGQPLGLAALALQLALEGLDRVDGLLLRLPVGGHGHRLLPEVGHLLVQPGQSLGRGAVGLLGQRHPLDLQLAQAPGDHVELGGHRVDLDAQPAGRLVHQVDGLVGQEPTGDVPVGQDGGGDQGGVLDADPVVDLVTLLQPSQDGDGVLDRRRGHEYLLEPTLEGGVLLDVLAVLVEGGGADHAQLAAGQHGLDHVAGVHGPLGAAGPHDGVELVDEGDHFALGVGDLLQDRLQALLELAAVLGPGHHRPHVQGDDPLPLQPLGDVPLDDAGGQALDDGRLSHARLADEHRVVLGAPGQHLDDPADLLVAPDDRVDLSLAGRLGQVPAVALERLEGLLGVLRGDPVAARARRAARVSNWSRSTPIRSAMASTRCSTERYSSPMSERWLSAAVEHVAQGSVDARLLPAERLGQAAEVAGDAVAHHRGLDTHPGQHRTGDAVGLVEDGGQQMVGSHFGVVGASGTFDRRGERLLGLESPAVGVDGHRVPPVSCMVRRAGRVGTGIWDSGTSSRRYLRWVRATASRASARVTASSPRSRATSASSSITWRTPSRLRPALVRLWMWRSRSRSLLAEPAAPALGAARVDQALALVDAKGLGMDAGQLGGHRDDVDGAGTRIVAHGSPPTPRPAVRPPRRVPRRRRAVRRSASLAPPPRR